MQATQDILDNLSTSIIALDGEMRVVSLNSSCQDLLESSEGRALGQPMGKLVANPEPLLEALQQVRATRSPTSRRSMPLELLSGRELQADLIMTPVGDGSGAVDLLLELQAVDRLLKISRDENLIHSQETTQEMIRGLAHEIKNPLGGVRGAAQLLARELPDDGLTEYTNIIIREADRLRDLVDRLLGPNQQLKNQALNIHEVFEYVRNLIIAEADNRVEFVRDYDPSLPDIYGDRGQLIQAVLNIVRNALQACEGRDDSVITLRTRPQRQFTIGTTRHRLVCRMDIDDNGPGIPEDMLHTIFMPMVTGRAEGTGLGLTIAQSIVTRHGGLLECTSESGTTRFSIYLPMETKHV
ncbi:PAS domain-containing protein [Halioglobus maricola]|uniref:Sensory histidine kinase/phosphatase NtrB n=1 Tax=Halioglobus maricola TaxID=2601894 RepID=A0A5P9NP41_9GAMM|nr:nitrogen regulation protein NR(II) [Halioglobus maricola]QFU77557.1 PAS domain-containing protein [Halioglobus maricola]